MTNPYYNHTTFPATSSAGSSSLARAEFDAITNGFALLPVLAGNGNDGLFVDTAGATITASGVWKLNGANLVATGSITAPSFVGPLTGSAATLSPGRLINGVLFDGSANITVAGTDSTKVLKAGDTMTGLLTATPAEAVRIANSAGYISGYDNTNTTRTGYLQFNAGGYVQLIANAAATSGVALSTTGGSLIVAQSGAVTASSTVAAAGFSGPLTGAASSNVLKAGDTMTGTLTAPGFSGPLTGAASSNVLKAGDTMTGTLTAPSFAGNVNITGGSGNLTMAGTITRFESAEQACPTVSALYGVSHTGPRKPDTAQAVMRCKVAEGGWSAGDELTLTDMQTDAGRAYQTYRNSTTVGVNITSAGTIALRATQAAGSALFVPTSANWRLVFYCTWL